MKVGLTLAGAEFRRPPKRDDMERLAFGGFLPSSLSAPAPSGGVRGSGDMTSCPSVLSLSFFLPLTKAVMPRTTLMEWRFLGPLVGLPPLTLLPTLRPSGDEIP